MDGFYGVIWNVEVQMERFSGRGLANLKAGDFRGDIVWSTASWNMDAA
jgi:hypothetical protein